MAQLTPISRKWRRNTSYRSQITCKSKFIIQTFYPQCFCNCASSSVCSGGNEDVKVPLKQAVEKKKGKVSGSTSNQFNPLDQTCIHPESYSIALRWEQSVALKLSRYCHTADDHWICLRIYPSGNKCLPQVGASGPVLLSVRVVRAAGAHMKSTFSVCSALSGSEWRSPRSCAAQVCLDYSNLTLVHVASRRCAHGCPVVWMCLCAWQLQVKSESVCACERGFWKLNMNRGHGIRMLWNLEDLLVNGNYNLRTRH